MTSQIHTALLVPTGAELIARAVALQPLLRAHASQGEIDRRQADEVIAGLTEAGFFRLLKPNRFGGFLTDVRTVLAVPAALGTADGSAPGRVGRCATGAWRNARRSSRAP